MPRWSTTSADLGHRLRARLVGTDTDGCWLWTGAAVGGYGMISDHRPERLTASGMAPVHRVAYQLWVGRLIPHHVVHHTCGVKLCANPAHLHQMSRIEHSHLHGAESARNWFPAFQCPQGHWVRPGSARQNEAGEWECLPCYEHSLPAPDPFEGLHAAGIGYDRLASVLGVNRTSAKKFVLAGKSHPAPVVTVEDPFV